MQIFHFADNSHPLQLGMLGGKGYSLAWMTQSGLPVPPGFVLTVRFFDPWVDKLKQTSQWRNFLSASSEKLTDRSMSLQAAGMDLSFTEEQEGQLKEALSRYQKFQFFAVRSSSPEEDLEGASFAGGYETILGVNRENMKNAVRRAFCSCLHPRVFIYKKERGFALEDFRIAVVVQAQVDSDVSGVGFSVNPLNNDYDEAVFNSNWGLGETVVSGLVSPDQIIVDKVSRKIINFQIGKKETSFWLNHDGGTEDRPDPRHKERTLTDEQVLGLTDQLSQIEALHGRPMDIEWALSGGKIFLLQARPITTHWPLPAILITPPHARRRLYLDISLVIQAMVEPISVLGTDILRGWLKAFFKEALGAERLVDVENGLVCAEGGRLYLNLSNAWHLFGSFGKLADKLQRMDALSSEILKQVDETAYKSLSAPKPIERI
ncbi:MAG: PEP/pyruvate-binding domain-containing protein, partial [Nitrospinales bacterium]